VEPPVPVDGRQAGHWCRGESPLAESGERIVDALGETGLAALEQR
jgi:hypothetical protein